MERIHRIPPSPDVVAHLYEEYLREARDQGFTFAQYLQMEGCVNIAEHHFGMDDGVLAPPGASLVSTPAHVVSGQLRVKVLLIDFPDLAGTLAPSHYEHLLFSKGTHPTGSMRDYFHEVSLGKVDVQGTVDGWLRMPEQYSFYANERSGLGNADGSSTYPRDARRMAEDAVQEALRQGVDFSDDLDLFAEGTITALFIVHAGVGAEVQRTLSARRANIWSHKWQMVQPVTIRSGMIAHRYLTVPHDCDVGVCAHELGHLAFQWEDFYDPNGSDDGREWDGSGDWDLMASGSYNGNSRSPSHPAAIHKAQHGWIEVEEVRSSKSVVIDPYTTTSGKAVRITSSQYRSGQYLMLENRAGFGFDAALPGEGLLVWRYDQSKEQFSPEQPALLLIQADGRHDLEFIETPSNWNAGDTGDPFPGSSERTELGQTGSISTSFPDGNDSGVELKNINRDPVSGRIELDVIIDGAAIGDGEDSQPADIVAGVAEPDVTIPDNDSGGVSSTITLSGGQLIGGIVVEVDIAHSYIGDLRVELEAPWGQRATLHANQGRGTDNLRKSYRSADHPGLAEMANGPIAGDWVLQVRDDAFWDVGKLKRWALTITPETQPTSVQLESKPNSAIPDDDANGITDTLHVARGGAVQSISVELDIAHTYRRDLRVELDSPGGDRVFLHNRTGGSADNVIGTFDLENLAALGAFVGTQARGDWVLRVADLEGQDRGHLRRWALDLDFDPQAVDFAREVKPAMPIAAADPRGVGSTVLVEAEGIVQGLAVEVDISHDHIGDLVLELVAPSGARSVLHKCSGGRIRDLRLRRDSTTAHELCGLVGESTKGLWLLRVCDVGGRSKGTLDRWSLALRNRYSTQTGKK